MRIKKLFAVGLSAVLAMGTFGYNSWAADKNGKDVSGNSNPEYVGGYIESELDNNVPEYYSDIAMFADNTVPSVFPENMTEFKSKYPALRKQNPYGTCWAFSSIGLAEFDLINDKSKSSDVDLSELQLAYFTYNSVVDPLGGTKGDYDIYHNENATENYLNSGGNYEYAIRRLSQWVGAVNESDVPYSEAANSLTNGIDASHAYDGNVAHLHNAYRVNIKTQPDEVKKAIMEHGAVGIMYTHYYAGANYVNNCYYDTVNTLGGGGGHAVMVVGWDDDYSTDNFTDDNRPANKGAWLVRNSWGDDFGYFWMSYDTYSLNEAAWVYDFKADDGYDNNYQLDGGLETSVSQYYNQAANVFTVKEKEGVESESLKAVSLSFMKTADVTYTVDVYTDMTDKTNPESGTKSASVTGSTTFAGYYTVPLDDEVTLNPGSTYAIVVKTDKNALEYEWTYSTSYNPSDDNSPIVWERKVSDNFNVDKNSLYYNQDNKYQVSPTGNWRIKAFTSDNLAKTDEGKVAEAKKVVEEAIKNVKGSNSLTKSDVQKVVNDALSKAGITDVTAAVGELAKIDATETAAGSIKADIIITCGAASDNVEFNKIIEKLPATNPVPGGTTPGDTTFKPIISSDVPEVKVDTDRDKIIDNNLDTAQKDVVNNGGSADIVLAIKRALDADIASDKKLIGDSFKSNEKIGMCLDISLLLTVTDKNGAVVDDSKKIPESGEMVTITITVPSELILTDNTKERTYKIVSVHNGNVEQPSGGCVWNAADNTITFKTNKFSTYAIVYSDADKPTNPETKPSTPETNPATTPTNPETKPSVDLTEPSADVTKPSESAADITESVTQASAEAVTEAQTAEQGEASKTGDATRLMMWIVIAFIGGCGIIGVVSRRKRFDD